MRRLAAIFAADVVGYSRLTEADELGTHAALIGHRSDAIEPNIAAHEGRVVKTTGDGILAEFGSVIDAVQCAVDIQRLMAQRNSGVAAERRIGINVGDVIVEDDDIYGDGVNVAARLEGLAEPGGICMSRSARDQIRDKLDLQLEDLGEQEVKNIARPVRVFRVDLRHEEAPAHGASAAVQAVEPALSLPDRPSVAVLPFDNMSGDPEQEYFVDGMTEDIITDLSKISGLFVIARNSVFAYKGKPTDIQEVSRKLGVRFVIEGSVRKSGDRVRINAQLVDGTTGGHLWAERYDRKLEDIFAVQDEVAQHIIEALRVRLTQDERARLERRGTENLEAYDFYLRGRDLFRRFAREDNAQARALYERATALDPTFAAAWAGVAATHGLDAINQWSDAPQASSELSTLLAHKSAALDDAEPLAHSLLAMNLLWSRDHDQALVEAERAIALDPNSSGGYLAHGQVLDYTGRHAEAIEQFDRVMRLDPEDSNMVLHLTAHAHFMLGRYEEAAALLRRRIARNPATDASRVLLAAAYGHLGSLDDARTAWREALGVNPDYSLEHRRKILPYKDPAQFERIVEGLAKAGLPE